MRIARWFGFVVLCSALSACNCNPGGNDGGSGGGAGGSGGNGGGAGGGAGGGNQAPGIDLADFCATAVTGMREQRFLEAAACRSPITRADVPHIFHPSGGTFEETFLGSACNDGGLATQMARYLAAANAGRLEYNREKALECQGLGRATRDDAGFPFNADGVLINPCSLIWTPKVAPGGACEADYECTGDNYCKPTSATACGGVCTARHPVGAGCSPYKNECIADAYCDQGADGGFQCLALLSAGDPCDSSAAPGCKPGLFCLGEPGVNETCLPGSKLGQPCKRYSDMGDFDSSFSNCIEGTCVSDAGEVEGALGLCSRVAPVGARCGNGFSGFGRCDPCLMCAPDDAGVTTCVDYGKVGQACADDSDCFMTDYYYCTAAGTCAAKPRVNETCLADLESSSGNCMYYDNWCKLNAPLPDDGGFAQGTCSPFPTAGQPCGFQYDRYDSCPSGNFCSGPEDAGIGNCAPLAMRDQRCQTGGSVFGVSPGCASPNDYCDTRPDAGATSTADGRCRARGMINEACSTTYPCAPDLICDPTAAAADGGARKCIPPKQNGASCTTSGQCQSGWCQADAGTCRALIGNGLPCGTDSECESGMCDPVSQVCELYCGVLPNEENIIGDPSCMRYDLASMSGYIFFSMVLVPLVRLRRKHKKR